MPSEIGEYMSINVNCFDLVEVRYLNEKKEPKVEFFSGNVDLAKEFIKNAPEKNLEVLSATYFIELMVRTSGSPVATQPSKRFAEHKFSPNEFLLIPAEWVKKTRVDANAEIDAYMAENYGATYKD